MCNVCCLLVGFLFLLFHKPLQYFVYLWIRKMSKGKWRKQELYFQNRKTMVTASASFSLIIARHWKPVSQHCLGHLLLVTLFTSGNTFWSIWFYILLKAAPWGSFVLVSSLLHRVAMTWVLEVPPSLLSALFWSSWDWQENLEVGQLEKLNRKWSLDWQMSVLCVFWNNLFASGAPEEVKFETNRSSWVL